jgi:hypothetical protein
MTTSTFIITTTKGSADQPWIMTMSTATMQAIFPDQVANSVNPFSAEEIQNVILPYHDFLKSLPGFQKTELVFVDDLNMQIKYLFDTEENARSAMPILTPPYDEGTALYNSRELHQEKRTQLGVSYTYSLSIE